MTRLFTIIALLGCSGGAVFLSAGMSWRGYEAAWAFGAIGPLIACSAVAFAFAAGLLGRDDRKAPAMVAALVAVLCAGADIYGNWLDTGRIVREERLAFIEGERVLAAAQDNLRQEQARIEAAEQDLAVIIGEDVRAAQRLLVGKGLYHGRIDGVLGPITQGAMLTLGADLRSELSARRSEADRLETIIEAKASPPPAAGKQAQAWALAIGLTLLSTLAANIAGMVGAGRSREQEMNADLAEAEQAAGELMAEVIAFKRELAA